MRPKVWKLLGVAGLAGVAATGVIIARDERRRTDLAPEEIRARLHDRIEGLPDVADAPEGEPEPTPRWRRLAERARVRTRRMLPSRPGER